MKIYTRKGDTGDTGLLFGGARVAKDSPRIEAAGSVDEAVAALGMARAALGAITDRKEARLSERSSDSSVSCSWSAPRSRLTPTAAPS